MNVLWAVLMLSAVIMHFGIAWSLYTLLGPAANSAGLVLLRQIFPDSTWPVSFALCGVLAFGGLFSVTLARAHFILAATVMWLWGIASLLMWPSIGPQPGGFLLLHIGILKFAMAIYADRFQRVKKATERLEPELAEAQETLSCHRAT